MRNLKKFLALVLAMVMAFSLMLSASAADVKYDDYKDKDSVTSEFVEAVSVLTGLKVVQGDGEEGNKNFRPKDNITRAEAAAMVYRIATGDVAGTQERLYSDYGKFTDVNSGDWFAGYVGYCQNAGIIKGTSPTTFNPYGKVTGYEVLAMILRAVGYGQNNEFTGPTWQVNVASMGKTKHITDSVVSDHFAYTLNMPATREIVAELLFRGSLIPQVTWTQIGGYNENSTLLGTGSRNAYLSEEVFGLSADPNDYTGAGWGFDTWGRPQFVWKADRNPSTVRTVATLKAQPKESFHDEKRECDIAELMEFGTAASNDYVLFVNGKTAVTSKYHVVATDTVTRVGGYGRQVEIFTLEDIDSQFPWHNTLDYYNNAEDEFTRLGGDIVVMIDTYLAKVVNKTDCVKDAAGHVITPARLIVDLYDKTDKNDHTPNRRTISKPATSDANWEFTIGDVISLNGLSSSTTVGGSGDERWAYTLPQVNVPSTGLVENTNVFALTKLDGVQGKQTTIYWNQDKHQVNGEDKTDDLALRMDKADANIDTTFTWYYDQYGYLLGIDDGGKVNYGVITSVYVSYGTNEDVNTDGIGKAIATVKYADGTSGTETLDYFLVNTSHDLDDTTTSPYANKRKVDGTMTSEVNTLQLMPVYNTGNNDPMLEADGMPYAPTDVDSTVAASKGIIYMAPVAATNSQAARRSFITNGFANDPLNFHGILNNNLFKFVKTAGDKTVAIEVAGGNNITPDATDGEYDGVDYTLASGNTGVFAGHWAATNSDTLDADGNAGTDGIGGKVFKSLAYVTKSDAAAANANIVTWLDNDTKIMIRNETNGSIACYDGVDALPGNVVISTSADTKANDEGKRYNEIDWADTDGDGRADVLYVTGSIEGVTAYGLFYTNDQSAQWNGTTATMDGFLNGQKTTLTFNSLDVFNQIKNAPYAGHLYGVRVINGVVNDVLETEWPDNTAAVQLLKGTNSTVTGGQIIKEFGAASVSSDDTTYISTGMAAGSDDFKYGDGSDAGYAGTNPYTATTEATYFKDYNSPANDQWKVEYNPGYNWNTLGGTVVATTVSGQGTGTATTRTFHLTPNSKVYGLGGGNVLAEGVTALEYLNHSVTNDVTIVYENNYTAGTNNAVGSILEIYIQTDPNWTPSNPVGNVDVTGATIPTIPDYVNNDVSDPNIVRDQYLKGLGAGLYRSNIDLSYEQDAGAAATALYFKFDMTTACTTAACGATLKITRSDGLPVYSETMTAGGNAVVSTGHYFYVQTANRSNGANILAPNAAGYWPAATGLASGTYYYTITGTSTNPVVSGGSGTFIIP